jgi:spore germination cell wall hydrolase CwlJ-like protein
MLDMAIVTCLALNIYHEARGESLDAQLLVAEVTINRAQEDNKTLCEVVWEDSQFSWTNDGKSDKPKDLEAYAQSVILANQALTDPASLLGSGANHYHEASILPKWAKHMTRLGQYGNHIFYTDKQ